MRLLYLGTEFGKTLVMPADGHHPKDLIGSMLLLRVSGAMPNFIWAALICDTFSWTDHEHRPDDIVALADLFAKQDPRVSEAILAMMVSPEPGPNWTAEQKYARVEQGIAWGLPDTTPMTVHLDGVVLTGLQLLVGVFPPGSRIDMPLVGCWADHKSGNLDPREVVRVLDDKIWIKIGDQEHGPYPADNYTYLPPREG